MTSPRTLALVLALATVVVGVEHRLDRPPEPRAADAPATEFSELRARPLLYTLSETVGPHYVGTQGLEDAIVRVAAELRRIPGVEVQVQTVEGAVLSGASSVTAYSVRNVVARLAGTSTDAVLLSAHIDAVPPSSGAGDDGVAVAAIVEVVRALAAGPKLARSIVVDLNGAEEPGLLGAHGFLSHPWAKDVRSFVNVDAAGAAGRAILFRVSPGDAWMVDAYAEGVPHPFGNVIGQDLFRAGLVPSDTDFHVYRDAKLPGVDLALFEDGWAYHTALDRYDRIEPGSLQHMGDDVLGLARALARATPAPSRGWPLFYDLLGVHLFHMSNATAHVSGWLVVLFTLVVVIALGRGRAVDVLRGAGLALVMLVAGLLLPLGVAAVVAFGLHRALGWFSLPVLGVLAYAPLAIGAMVLVSSKRRDATGHALGALLVSALVLAFLVLEDVGSAYVLAWWCLALSASVLVARRAPLAVVALVAVPLCFTIEIAAQLVRLAMPLMGRAGFGPASELAIAAAITLPLVVTLAPLVALLPSSRTLARAALVLGALGVVATVVHPPYTHDRPQRAILEDSTTDGNGKLEEHDAAHLVHPGDAHATHTLPAPTVTIARGEPKDGLRSVELTLTGPSAMRLVLPPGLVRGWSIPLPVPHSPRPLLLRLIGHEAGGRTVHLRLDVPADTTETMSLTAVRIAHTPALDALVVPANVTVDSLAKTSVQVPLGNGP